MSEQIIKTLKEELGKTLKLVHISSAAGMFYGGKNCLCCKIPTIYKIGEYRTVRYGTRDEYFLHMPKESQRVGEVEFEGKKYIIFSVNNELFAIYNKHNEGVGWLTIVYQIKHE